MGIKSIIVAFNGFNEELSTLDVAFQLAKRFDAHLTVWHISPDPLDMITAYAGSGYIGPFYDDALIKRLEEPYEKEKTKAESKFHRMVEKHGLSIGLDKGPVAKACASFVSCKGDAGKILEVKGRLADLIVTTRPWDKNVGRVSGILNQCLFNTGRPLLVVPPGDGGLLLNHKIAIAWDGSAEVARAVALAMPLLENSSVSAITAMSNNAKDFPLTPEDISGALKRHGIEANTVWCEIETSVEQTLLEAAQSCGASILIMGNYTHNRFAEIIFGGTTEYMLEKSNMPLLLAH